VSDPTDDEVIEWLRCVRLTGAGLDKAPEDMLSALLFDERRGEWRSCCVCGYRRATAAYIARTGAGNRWVDVCWTDYSRVRELNELAPDYSIG
jgi:hypothetical protein